MVDLKNISDKEIIRTILDYEGEEFRIRLLEVIRKTQFHDHPKIKNLHLASGSEKESDYNNLISGVQKLIKHSDEIWIITNYGDIKSADFIVRNGRTLKYIDQKTIHSFESIEQEIMKHQNQARRFFLYITNSPCRANDIAGHIQKCFFSNNRLSEIIIANGGKFLSIDKKNASQVNYYAWFKKNWK